MSYKTNTFDNYQSIKDKVKQINSGKIHDMTLEQILRELLHRKVGERAIRMCTPISQGFKIDEVPSPKAKTYENISPIKLPSLKTNQSNLPMIDNIKEEEEAKVDDAVSENS